MGASDRSGSNGGKYDQNMFYICVIFKVRSLLTRSGMKGPQKTSSSTLLHQMTTGTKWSAVDPSKAIHEVQKFWCIKVRIQPKVIFILLVLMQWTAHVRVIVSSISWFMESSAFILPSSPFFSLHLPHSFTQPWSPVIPPELSFKPLLSKISLFSPGCFIFPIVVVGLF